MNVQNFKSDAINREINKIKWMGLQVDIILMSYAHYFVKNFKIKEVVDLFCYNTRFPHTLTSTQKITRLYRCVLRRQKALTFFENRGDPKQYYEFALITRRKLDRLMDISESSPEFKETLQEYQTWIRDTMEPTILFKECRPYNPTSGKYYIFNDQQLSYDPFGYYSGAPLGGSHNNKLGHLFYQNFPMDAKAWNYAPIGLINDTPVDSGYTK